MKRHQLAASLAACTLLAFACRNGLAPDMESLPDLLRLPIAEQPLAPDRSALRVARVRTSADSARVEVPASARVGEPVQVHVTTYGGGCVAEDTTVVRVKGGEAVVVPYQLVRSRGVCTKELRITRRVVSVVFMAPGPALVTVIGRGPSDDSLAQFVRQLTVRQ